MGASKRGDVLSGCCCLERTTAPSSAIHQGEQVNSGGQDLETPALSAEERFPGLASEIIVFAECSCQEPIFAHTCCVSCSANTFVAHHFASLHDHLSSGLGELLSTIRKALKRALKQGNSSTTIPIIVRQASQVANRAIKPIPWFPFRSDPEPRTKQKDVKQF